MLAFMNIPFFKSWCVTCVIYVALFALHWPTIWSPHALTFFKKPRLVHELFWRQNWERSMHFPSILISISFVFLQIISKGSCGKCFVQFAFGSRMFNTFAIDTHEPSIVRFALRFNMLVVWLTLLKILIQQRCLLSSWAWELLFERPRQIWKCGWLDFALCLVFTYAIYRSVFILG